MLRKLENFWEPLKGCIPSHKKGATKKPIWMRVESKMVVGSGNVWMSNLLVCDSSDLAEIAKQRPPLDASSQLWFVALVLPSVGVSCFVIYANVLGWIMLERARFNRAALSCGMTLNCTGLGRGEAR